MQQIIMYASILLFLSVLGWAGVALKEHLGGLVTIVKILEIVDFITKQFEFRYKEDVTKIIQYVLEALHFVDKYEEVDGIEARKELIMEKALIICQEEGLDLGDGTVIEIVNRLVEYVIAEQMAESIKL